MAVGGKVVTDNAAARLAILRSGSGRMKHVQLNMWWVQGQAAKGELVYEKVDRKFNVADLMTHHWSVREGENHLKHMSVSRQ